MLPSTILRALVFPFLVPLAFAPADDLCVTYAEGVTVTSESERTFSMDVVEVTVLMNGEELPPEAAEEMASEFGSEESVEIVRTTTTFLEVDDEGPVRVRRAFDRAWKSETEDDEETETESPLEGLTLLLARGDDDDVVAELEDEDEEVDPVHFANQRMEYTVARYLSEGGVDVGDTWDLDEDLILELIGEGGPELFDPDEEDDAFTESMIENLEASITITYEANEERDGVACALLVLAGEVESMSDDLGPDFIGDDEDMEGMDISGSFRVRLDVVEKTWLSLEDGRPVATISETGGEMTIELAMENADLGLLFEFSIEAEISAGETTTTSVE